MSYFFRLSVFFSFFIFALIAVINCRLLQHTDLSGRDPATRTVFIHNFTNNTFQSDVNVELTEFLAQDLSRRDNFKVVAKREDARIWVYGDIVLFSQDGRMYDNYQNPVRYEMMVVCKTRLRENPEKSVPGKTLEFSGEQSSSIQFSAKEGYIETEFGARQRLLRMLAGRISDAMEQEYLAWNP